MPTIAIAAIERYLKHRGRTPGPLFQTRGNRGKRRDGRLETRSVLRIIREHGQGIGIHVWCHGLRHTAITAAIEKGPQAGIGLDQIRAYSRHRNLATMLIYRDEHNGAVTQRRLGDIVAATLEQARDSAGAVCVEGDAATDPASEETPEQLTFA